MKISVKSCARCGEDHEVDFQPLDNHETYTHWAMCPNKEQPILMEVVSE
jgi:hypothetical protein